MADNLTLNFEIYRGEDLLFKEQISAESVTIGKGPAAMLRIEDDSLADLQAVINLSDEGTVQILDLVGSGTKVNGNEVVNSELVSGDNIAIGEIRILVEMEGEITATNPTINSNHIDGTFYTDLNFTAKINVGGADGQFFLNVTNLFDTNPILLPETGLSANSTYSDLLGRAFRIGVRFKTN